MYILAFETSCDDTSVAIMKDSKLISMSTISQIREHNITNGVVPEIAARLHSNNIFIALDNALGEANLDINQIDYVVCTESPGLLPSLIVGKTVANTISKLINKPIIFVNHITAHIFSNLLDRKLEDLIFPSICLTVSGGHNEIYLWKSLFELELIGESLDDSAGEAFDKVAKMMGLGYPGGPIISEFSSKYIGKFNHLFPLVLLDKDSLDFSFSGLKSAVKREVDKRIAENKVKNKNQEDKKDYEYLTENDKIEISFEFENTTVEILKNKLFRACEKYGINSVLLAGGVSANDRLKQEIELEAKKRGYKFISPMKKLYTGDNAAMVGILGYYRQLRITN